MAATQLPFVWLFVLGSSLIKHSKGDCYVCRRVVGSHAAFSVMNSVVHMLQIPDYHCVVLKLGVQGEHCQTI